MQVRAALSQQMPEMPHQPLKMPEMPHQPFSFHGRPPAAQEPLCDGDAQTPPRNRENGTLPALCAALGLPLLGPQGLSQGADRG